MLRIPFSDLNASLTLLESAQVFLFRRTVSGFGGYPGGKLLILQENGDSYVADGDMTDSEIIDYLGLDIDYTALCVEYKDFPVIQKAFRLLPGLRVLRQPTWDTLLSFICSANNNTRRIYTLVANLCERYGTNLNGLIGLPGPSALAEVTEQELRDQKFGYRARYLCDTARLVRDGFDPDAAAAMPYSQAKAHLMYLPGVGPKVADCILLFGCGHTEAFPVDVWVERLLQHWFGIVSNGRVQSAEQARALLGPHAGLAQQFLFHCARTGLIDPNSDRIF